MALTKKQKEHAMLAVMGSAAFLYVYWNYGIKPTNEKIAATEAKLVEILSQVEDMKRTANRLPALQREYEGLVSEVGKAEKKLPKEKNLEDVLRVVTEKAIKEKIDVRSFVPESELAKSYFVEVPVRLSVAGSFHSVAKFLAVLGQQERILSARDLQLSFVLDEKKGQTVSGSFVLQAYMFRG